MSLFATCRQIAGRLEGSGPNSRPASVTQGGWHPRPLTVPPLRPSWPKRFAAKGPRASLTNLAGQCASAGSVTPQPSSLLAGSRLANSAQLRRTQPSFPALTLPLTDPSPRPHGWLLPAKHGAGQQGLGREAMQSWERHCPPEDNELPERLAGHRLRVYCWNVVLSCT